MRELADPERAAAAQLYFKTGPGEYAEGDRFLGVTMPALRRVAHTCQHAGPLVLTRLLTSPWHEERMLALLVMVRQRARGKPAQRERLFRQYLRHRRRVNNWDLVDGSAPYIVGPHVAGRNRGLIADLAASPHVWDRRIAVLATFHDIECRRFGRALALARRLVTDPHDLIHKAVGWMLREVGKRNRVAEERFLREHAARMPRTMLRYAIERFPDPVRRRYLRQTARPTRRHAG